VHVESSQLRRVRARELTPTWFRRLAFGAVGALYVIVVTGALVRLTASGLGCDSWPGCDSRTFFPQNDIHGVVEFGNRVFGVVPITLSVLLWLGAWRTPGLPRWTVLLAAGVALGTLAQAPLGLLTITSGLHPLLVMAHFLLALVVLGGAVVVALEALGLERGRAPMSLPVELRRLGLVAVVACLGLVVTGAFVTAAGPHPGDSADIRRLGTLEDALWVHVRVTAVFGCAFLLLVGYLAARRAEHPRLFRAALGVLALLLVQMAVGELQYRLELPWGLVLAHVGLAAAVWIAVVGFVTLLWRPWELRPSAGAES
jgi:cytochrome c oxidase assembly protein subunit 15